MMFATQMETRGATPRRRVVSRRGLPASAEELQIMIWRYFAGEGTLAAIRLDGELWVERQRKRSTISWN